MEDHPLRAVVGVSEVFDDLDPLQESLVRLWSFLDHLRPELAGQCVQIQLLKQGSYRFGADTRGEGHPVTFSRFEILFLGEKIHLFQVGIARIDDNVLLVVEDGTETPNGEVQQQSHTRRHGTVIPDVRDRRRQLNMPHTLSAHLEVRDFDATTVTNHTLVSDGLKLSAITLPLFCSTENTLTEKPIFLGAQSPIIDGLGFLDLAVTPCPHLIRCGKLNSYTVKVLNVSHTASSWGVSPYRGVESLADAPSFRNMERLSAAVSPAPHCGTDTQFFRGLSKSPKNSCLAD